MSTLNQPVIIHQSDLEWESWPEADRAKRGLVHWKTLLSRDKTESYDLTVGIARLTPGQKLARHRHAQAEMYYMLKGVGVMHVAGTDYAVEGGTIIFIPGDAVHGISNSGDADADVEWLYAFPTDSFSEVIYDFDVGTE